MRINKVVCDICGVDADEDGAKYRVRVSSVPLAATAFDTEGYQAVALDMCIDCQRQIHNTLVQMQKAAVYASVEAGRQNEG